VHDKIEAKRRNNKMPAVMFKLSKKTQIHTTVESRLQRNTKSGSYEKIYLFHLTKVCKMQLPRP